METESLVRMLKHEYKTKVQFIMKPLSPLSLKKGYVSVKKSADQNLRTTLLLY